MVMNIPSTPQRSTTVTTSASARTPTDQRISQLQPLADIDAGAAQDAAWAWIQHFSAGLPGHVAERELAQVFAGCPAAAVDGKTDGLLLGWTTVDTDLSIAGRMVRALAKTMTAQMGVMPWLGKNFDR